MATKKTRVEVEPGNGTGSGRKDVDLSMILSPEQLALHKAGFQVPISLKIKAALLGEFGRTAENRSYLVRKGLRESTLREIRNGRSVRYLLSEVLAEQERLIRGAA